MKVNQLIHVYSLKHFLALFNADCVLENLQLGDTAYPLYCLMDETILKGKNTVQEILNFPYNFLGLILFTCRINDILYYMDYCGLETTDNSTIV
jgi:hypothetical protein